MILTRENTRICRRVNLPVIRSKEANYRLTATTAHTARNSLGVSREEQRKRGFSFRMERGRNDFLLHKFIKFIVSRLGTGIGTFPETDRGVVSGS